jgi:hypothetical protein
VLVAQLARLQPDEQVLSPVPHYTTPRRAARVIAKILTDPSTATGSYDDENGKPMQASKQVSDPAFSDRYTGREPHTARRYIHCVTGDTVSSRREIGYSDDDIDRHEADGRLKTTTEKELSP